MLYDGLNHISELLGVDKMQWSGGDFDISPRSYAALGFRIKGNALITTNRKRYEVHANDVLYLPQELAYKAEYSDTELLVVHFKTVERDLEPEVYSLNNSDSLYNNFLRMQILWEKKEAGYRVDIASLLYRVLGSICREKNTASLHHELLECVSYMNSSFRNPGICVNEICREAGISETSFRRLMKEHYRKTPVEYLTELRIEYARNLISCGTSVEQAALESGFNDSKYFARTVKKHLGCTPRELKNFGK